jgi:hypothetical protein
MALAWKAGWVNSPRGFESRILRHAHQHKRQSDHLSRWPVPGACLGVLGRPIRLDALRSTAGYARPHLRQQRRLGATPKFSGGYIAQLLGVCLVYRQDGTPSRHGHDRRKIVTAGADDSASPCRAALTPKRSEDPLRKVRAGGSAHPCRTETGRKDHHPFHLVPNQSAWSFGRGPVSARLIRPQWRHRRCAPPTSPMIGPQLCQATRQRMACSSFMMHFLRRGTIEVSPPASVDQGPASAPGQTSPADGPEHRSGITSIHAEA